MEAEDLGIGEAVLGVEHLEPQPVESRDARAGSDPQEAVAVFGDV